MMRTELFIDILYNSEQDNVFTAKFFLSFVLLFELHHLLLKCWRKAVKPHMWILQDIKERVAWLTLKPMICLNSTFT